MSKAKRVCLLLLLALLSASLAGCGTSRLIPQAGELELSLLVRLVGIDVAEDGMIELTAMCITSPVDINNKDDAKNKIFIRSMARPTIAEITYEMPTRNERNYFWGQVDYIIVGNEALHENIPMYLDFLVRDPRFRLSAEVYATPGKAKDLINMSRDIPFVLTDYLDVEKTESSTNSIGKRISLMNLMGEINESWSATAIPLLFMENDEVMLNGYAVAKDRRAIYEFIDTTGYNYAINSVTYDMITLKDGTGGYISMNVSSASTKITPVVEDGELKRMRIETSVVANLNEQHHDAKAPSWENMGDLEDRVARHIHSQIGGVVRQSQLHNADVIKFGKFVNLRHPLLWDKIGGNWNAIYPTLPVDIVVRVHIDREYDLSYFEKEWK